MDFNQVIGNQHIKAHLEKTLENGRIPHAQLFCGNNGAGLLPMALAYASQLLARQFPVGSAESLQSHSKVSKLAHPDLHFVYPVNTNEEVKKNPVSDDFIEAWRKFVGLNPYASVFEWLQFIRIENKQGNISKNEAESMSKKLSLKSFEGGYKVMIIWMAEHMNTECANKILKLIEEPSERTVLLLLTEDEGSILTTIHSRCQKLIFPLLAEADIADALRKYKNVEDSLAIQISRRSRGNYNHALHLLNDSGGEAIFEKWFIRWVRTAFKAKGNKGAINGLLDWSDELSAQGRETQKKFLVYCIEIFRQGLLQNYKSDELIFFEPKDQTFSLAKFAPFIHQNNIIEITEALEQATYNIERNGNPKILFTDLSIKLTRLIHTPQSL